MNEKPASRWADLGVRTASAVALIPLVLAAIWFGGFVFTGFAVALGILVAVEWVRIAFGADRKQLLLHELAAAALIMGSLQWALAAIGVLWVVSLSLLRKTGFSFWRSVGVPYVGLPILAMSALRDDAQLGIKAVVWCMVIVWSADVMAYFFGRIIGGPKLAPQISPKKTWAGLAGAIVGAVVASILFSRFAFVGAWPLAGLAGMFAVLEQGGDIFESAFKRHYGVKDSGSIIPGHGGVLDRIDGLIVVLLAAVLVGFIHNPASPAAGLLLW
jgi:phosphatidate cytidylyltransferase